MRKILVALAAALLLAASVSAADWQIDPVHSNVGFKVTHMVVSRVKGKFNEFSGTIKNFDGENFKNASVEVKINAKSINTDNERRDNHLRSSDFLAVDSFPTISFVSTSVSPSEDGKFQVMGNLTIRGVTKPVTLDAEYNGRVALGKGQEKTGFSATTTINRQDWGVSWNKTLDAGGLVVSDDVDLIFEIEANKSM